MCFSQSGSNTPQTCWTAGSGTKTGRAYIPGDKVFIIRPVIVSSVVTYYFGWYAMHGEDFHGRVNDSLACALLWNLPDAGELAVVVSHNEVRLSF